MVNLLSVSAIWIDFAFEQLLLLCVIELAKVMPEAKRVSEIGRAKWRSKFLCPIRDASQMFHKPLSLLRTILRVRVIHRNCSLDDALSSSWCDRR
jgi:hypothetical protein